MSHMTVPIAMALGLTLAVGGCGEDKEPKKKKKVVSRTITDHKKADEPADRPPAEGVEDEVDQAWNEPPTPGQAKVRMVVTSEDGPIKGRPSFMAPQFTLTANEMHESLHKDGDEPTGVKQIKHFNPNDAGRYVFELAPGRWQLHVADNDKQIGVWDSPSLLFLGDDARAVDVKLRPAAPDKGN